MTPVDVQRSMDAISKNSDAVAKMASHYPGQPLFAMVHFSPNSSVDVSLYPYDEQTEVIFSRTTSPAILKGIQTSMNRLLAQTFHTDTIVLVLYMTSPESTAAAVVSMTPPSSPVPTSLSPLQNSPGSSEAN